MPQSFLVEGTGPSPVWDQGFLNAGAQIYCLVYLSTAPQLGQRGGPALLLLEADKTNCTVHTH